MRSDSIRRRGFTLVELLVVVAVIGILIGVLLPALAGARRSAQELQIATNLRSVGQAVAAYNATTQFFPPAYVYGSRKTGGSWKEAEQTASIQPGLQDNGYVHWSWALFDGEFEGESEAFTSPLVPDGGAPPTNPGPDPQKWADQQVNDKGQGPEGGNDFPHDRQVDRVAFTGNGAIFPRNKFALTTGGSTGWERDNRLVNPAWIRRPSDTILATEFAASDNWTSLWPGTGGLVAEGTDIIKSHRPVTPFKGLSEGTGNGVYRERDGERVRYTYPSRTDLQVASASQYTSGRGKPFLIEDPQTELNAVGRQHPGGDELGGTTYFLYTDGAVNRTTLWSTIENAKWGDRFYSLTGSNIKVLTLDDLGNIGN